MADLVPEGLRLTVTTDTPADLRPLLLKEITAFNARTVGGELSRFAAMLHDSGGVLMGGLSAALYWEWMFVEALWVHESRRGQGAGGVLLGAAERHALAEGCHSVWLDTFQARGFYVKQGYAVFGALEDYPPGQTRYFLRKRL